MKFVEILKKVFSAQAVLNIGILIGVFHFLSQHFFDKFKERPLLDKTGWVALLICCSMAVIFIYHREFTRKVRRFADRHEGFSKLGLIILALGLIAESFRSVGGANAWWGWGLGVSFAGMLLTFFGFLFSIYSIKGLFERPRGMGETIDRAVDALREYQEANLAIVLLCEYPAWGCLSEAEKCGEFEDAFRKIAAKKGTLTPRIVLVAPQKEKMKNHIATYARDYNKLAELDDAVALNDGFMDMLGGFSTMFKHHVATPSSPRYQMLLVCKYEIRAEGKRKIIPRHAIIWLAPRSSEEIVEYSGNSGETTKTVVSPAKGSARDVFAWEIRDPRTLKGLLDHAFFFANNAERIDDSDFLGFTQSGK